MGHKINDISESQDNMRFEKEHSVKRVKTVGVTSRQEWFVKSDSRFSRRAKKRAEKKKK